MIAPNKKRGVTVVSRYARVTGSTVKGSRFLPTAAGDAAYAATSSGLCVFSQSRSAAFISLCQPGPVALNASNTSTSSRMLTRSLGLGGLASVAGLRAIGSGLAGKHCQTLGAGSGGQRLGDKGRIVASQFDTGFKIHSPIRVGFEVVGAVPFSQFDFSHSSLLAFPRQLERVNHAESASFERHPIDRLAPCHAAQPFPTIANYNTPAYSSPVVTLLATGFGDSNTTRRTSAHHPKAGAFFVPVASSYGGCAWDTFGYAGFRVSRFANLRTAATQYRLATIRGSSTTHGAVPMNHIHTALKNRAAAHKAMAFAALRADSSASVRLGRYRKHITRSRTLLALADVVGGAV